MTSKLNQRPENTNTMRHVIIPHENTYRQTHTRSSHSVHSIKPVTEIHSVTSSPTHSKSWPPRLVSRNTHSTCTSLEHITSNPQSSHGHGVEALHCECSRMFANVPWREVLLVRRGGEVPGPKAPIFGISTPRRGHRYMGRVGLHGSRQARAQLALFWKPFSKRSRWARAGLAPPWPPL